jgi:hypothetical protein
MLRAQADEPHALKLRIGLMKRKKKKNGKRGVT